MQEPTSRRSSRRILFALMSGVLVWAGLTWGAVPAAHADWAPQDPSDPTTTSTVTADALPTAQINGVVWAQAVVGNTVYAGGNFTSARPAGAALGTNETPRSNLLSYDITTGVLTSFAPVVNGDVRTIAVSPDQSRIYIGGTFTSIDGQPRSRIAAFDATSGALISSFAPPVNYDVYSIVATNSTVYVGGDFQDVGTHPRGYLAAFTPSGALLDWAPQAAGGHVWALALSPDGTKLAVAGQFTSLNGSSNPGYGLGMVDAVTGASLPMDVNSIVRDGGTAAGITSLSSDSNGFYGGSYTFGAGGTLEGIFGASWNGGTTTFVDDCHGDVYSVWQRSGSVYIAGHTHDCANVNGFPETPSRTWHRGLAFGTTPTGTATHNWMSGYGDFTGTPDSSLLSWFPTLNIGTFTGLNQGPWSVSGNSDYVVYGGEFTKVNDKPQQGLVRFPAAAVSPKAQGPSVFGASYPLNLSSTEAGKVRINWTTNQDMDNSYLTYRVYRDVQQGSGLVYQTQARADWWAPYTMGFTDSGVAPGSTHQYRVAVTDPAGNIANSPWTSITVAASGTDSSYLKAVYGSQPVDYWRLGNAAKAPLADAVGFSPMTAGAGVAPTTPAAISGDADGASSFTGDSTGVSSSKSQIAPPNSFSLETWFKTSTSTGGEMLGFGSAQTGNSGTLDRLLYLDNSGHVLFGVNPGTVQTVASPSTYRNNAWHHVVATLSRTSGMKLYVDGALVASKATVTAARTDYWGYWRLGGDNLASWPSRPSSNYYKGSLDDVALYHRDLTAAEVSAHYAAGMGSNVAPTATFQSSTSGLALSVDGSASSDVDGTVASYAWDFGDGTSASGPTSTHTYAVGGTYTVTLTVTDNVGASSSTSKSVTVVRPNAAPTAAFTASMTDLGLTADASASSDSDGQITGYVWNFGDQTSGSGSAVTHTYAQGGTYQVTLTVTDNDGATSTTSKTVTAVPPNQPPSASFTTTADHLVVQADASTSVDSDGQITSYTWDFGDGATATGVTAGHTYAAAGTYPVTLTVTDDRGASVSVSKPVTVTSLPAPFALDSFARVVTGGWGTADVGGAWTRSGNSANYAVNNGTATIKMAAAGSGPSISLGGVSSSDSEVRVSVGLDKQPTGQGVYVTVRPRVVASGDSYYAETRMLPDGSVGLSLGRTVTGADTVLGSLTVPALTVSPGDRLAIRVQAFGTSPTTLRAKVWKVGTPEPAAWLKSVTDTSASVQAPGSLALGTYLSSSATNAPVTASFSDFWGGPTS